MTEQGNKNDQGKPELALIPPHAELGIGQAMTYGAKKYGQHNYLGGIKVLRLISAAKRHINAFVRGETIDPESKLPHLHHAGASIAMAIEMMERRPDLDDRYQPPVKEQEQVLAVAEPAPASSGVAALTTMLPFIMQAIVNSKKEELGGSVETKG